MTKKNPNTEKNKGGRPKRHFTVEEREKIVKLSKLGAPELNIAGKMKCDLNTLKKHCQAEIDLGRNDGMFWGLGARHAMIMNGNWSALKHYFAVTHGMVERQEVTGSNGVPLGRFEFDE